MPIKKTLITLLIFVSALNLSGLESAYADDKSPKKVKIKKKKINFSLNLLSQNLKELKPDESFYAVESDIAFRWLPIVTLIRDGKIDRQSAIDSMFNFTNEVWEYLDAAIKKNKTGKYSVDEWVFPVKGYTPAAIGGRNGSGYISAGFDFFEQKSGGHPAHDIFIKDVNQDCLDDFTNRPVEIISMSGGLVVETRKDWTPDRTDIRGGNIVYVYDNFTNGLFYYAHLNEVYVNIGDFVKPGTELGTMGRTGANAYPKRSPTHLHLMYVRSLDGDLVPEDIYNDLLNAKLTD